MPRADDVVSAALRHLDDGVVPHRVDPAAFRDDTEGVFTRDPPAVEDEFVAVVRA